MGSPALSAYRLEQDGSETYLVADRELHRGDVVLDRVGGVVQDSPTRHSVQVADREHLEVSSDLRFTNHSCDPNCRLQILDGQVRTVLAGWLHRLRRPRPSSHSIP